MHQGTKLARVAEAHHFCPMISCILLQTHSESYPWSCCGLPKRENELSTDCRNNW